jgi:hypothetical protein
MFTNNISGIFLSSPLQCSSLLFASGPRASVHGQVTESVTSQEDNVTSPSPPLTQSVLQDGGQDGGYFVSTRGTLFTSADTSSEDQADYTSTEGAHEETTTPSKTYRIYHVI